MAAKKASKKTAKKKATRKIQAYAFIDTNIFLDFYRASEATLGLLEKLEQVRDRIICTYQVEMEFLKNRQAEICRIANQANLNLTASLPAALADTQLSSSVRSARKDLQSKQKKLDQNLLKLLRNPNEDRVFQVLEKVFRSDSDHVLTRDMEEEKARIKRLARRRFQLGYPPRKSGDTSMGDAFNWEWIVHCATKLKGRIIIVSRDSDFGTEYKKEYFLNDQLMKEFRERVGRKSLLYTQKLSEALDELKVRVTKQERETEAREIAQPSVHDTVRKMVERRLSLESEFARANPNLESQTEEVARRIRENQKRLAALLSSIQTLSDD